MVRKSVVARQDRWSQERRMEVFVAHSATPEDKDVVNFFCDILKGVGFIPNKISGPNLENLTEDVEKAINLCPVFAAIITKRAQRVGRKKEYSGPAWIYWEGALAKKDRKIILVFREDVVTDIGPYSQIEGAPLIFNRSDLAGALGPTFDYLEQVERKLRENPLRYSNVNVSELTHAVKSVEKVVHILPDGHALMEFVYSILITEESCKFVQHRIGLNEFTEGPMLSLKEMMKSPLQDKYSCPTFSYRLLEPPPWRGPYTMEPIEVPSESTEKVKVFEFHFKPEIPNGQAVTYSWGVSYPKMFRSHGTDASDFFCGHKFFDLNLTVLFGHRNKMEPWKFKADPELWVLDPLKRPIATILTTAREHLYWKEYSWRQLASSLGYTYRVVWEAE